MALAVSVAGAAGASAGLSPVGVTAMAVESAVGVAVSCADVVLLTGLVGAGASVGWLLGDAAAFTVGSAELFAANCAAAAACC